MRKSHHFGSDVHRVALAIVIFLLPAILWATTHASPVADAAMQGDAEAVETGTDVGCGGRHTHRDSGWRHGERGPPSLEAVAKRTFATVAPRPPGVEGNLLQQILADSRRVWQGGGDTGKVGGRMVRSW